MKIVLVYPPPIPILSKSYDSDNHNQMSGLGLLYLATVVKDKHDVTIIGGTANPIPADEIVEQISELKPDILGISTIFSTLIISGKIIAKEIKKRFPKTTIIFGGNHATFIADELAREKYVDIVVVGEGEVTFKEVVEKIDLNESLEDTKGIVFRKNGKIVRTPPRPNIKDIDTIPFPDWTLHYDKMPKSIPMCSSRGCPHDCIYCSTTSFWGRKWRPRSAQNMVDEIKYTFDVFSPEQRHLEVGFVDDNFTVNRERVKTFSRLVQREDFEIQWGASSRIELIDDELLEIMADSGCKDLFFGVESGSDRVLKLMNRHYTVDEVKAKVEKCLEYGILSICSFMIGNPFEDKSDIEKTFSLLKELRSYKVQVHIFTPLIGTEVFINAGKYGVKLIDEEYNTMRLESKALLNTRYLKAQEIEDAHHKGWGYILKRYREAALLEKVAKENRARRAESLKIKNQHLRKAS